MKKIVVLAVCIFFVTVSARSQTAIDSVKATIDKLFHAMKTGNGIAFKECFNDSAIMQTIAWDKSGATIVKNEALKDFVTIISSMPNGAADERITYNMVKTDGPLAIAWTPYKFYLNGQFSHCGVNSFHLVRLNGIWKVQYLIDTRRKQNCE